MIYKKAHRTKKTLLPVAAFAAVGLAFTWPNPSIARVRPISAVIGVACQELSLAGQG